MQDAPPELPPGRAPPRAYYPDYYPPDYHYVVEYVPGYHQDGPDYHDGHHHSYPHGPYYLPSPGPGPPMAHPAAYALPRHATPLNRAAAPAGLHPSEAWHRPPPGDAWHGRAVGPVPGPGTGDRVPAGAGPAEPLQEPPAKRQQLEQHLYRRPPPA